MVKIYVEMDDFWLEVFDYFKSVIKNEKSVYWKMENLAKFYVGLDKDKEVIEFYNYFIEKEFNFFWVIEFIEEVLGVCEKIGDFGEVDWEICWILGYFKL